MGSGGGSSPPPPPTATSQTITQSDLPEYAKPFYIDLMERSQAESNRAYQPYGSQRIQGFDPLQSQAQDAAGALTRPDQFGNATNMAYGAGLGSLNANFDNQSWTQAGTADQFMSPYIQNVVDVQKDEAIRDAQKGILSQNLGAGRRGTYGGSRQLLAGIERERNLGDELSQIQARGTQQAYQQGQQQFNQEEAMRLQGADFGLRGLGQAIQGAQTMGALGEAQQATDLQRIQAQAAAGSEKQDLEQQRLDTSYGDFLRQRDYPKEQLNFFNAQLRGVPMPQLSSTSTAYAQPPSAISQIGGLGLAGLGLYNTFNS